MRARSFLFLGRRRQNHTSEADNNGAVKGFLPQVPPESFPAAALAAFIYYVSGIRVTKGPPLAASQTARGAELLRLAVPARRYLPGTSMMSRKPFNTPMRDARKKSMD
ncbi:MAG TPA: hypothetical protein VN966_05655 [Candidatus Bathyarchaeia archaeon]|nr:hypothetical protein [Candidatus Bathyarchaeia archaeon]